MAQQMSTTERVALHVGAVLEAQGRKVTWLVEQTGIPRSNLYRLLKGLHPFNLNELDRIAEALGMSTSDFLVDDEVAA